MNKSPLEHSEEPRKFADIYKCDKQMLRLDQVQVAETLRLTIDDLIIFRNEMKTKFNLNAKEALIWSKSELFMRGCQKALVNGILDEMTGFNLSEVIKEVVDRLDWHSKKYYSNDTKFVTVSLPKKPSFDDFCLIL